MPSADEIETYFSLSRKAGWYSNSGPCADLLVERIRSALSAEPVLVANCTLGLVVALQSVTTIFGTAERRYVLCPSYTFVATASAITTAGFQPYFVDVDPSSWQPDPDSIRCALEACPGDVASVLATSTFGCPAPTRMMDEWETICRDNGLPLVVDSAAAFGAVREDGMPVGRQGDAEVFSFHATKPFAIGEGGLLTTRHIDVAALASRLVNFGFGAERVATVHGTNAKMSEMSAAVALAVWDRYPEILAARRARAGVVTDILIAHGFRTQTGGALGTWQMIPAQTPSEASRLRLLSTYSEEFVEARAYYSSPLHAEGYYSSCPSVEDMSVTNQLAARAISLPMANDLTPHELERIVAFALGQQVSESREAHIAAQMTERTENASDG